MKLFAGIVSLFCGAVIYLLFRSKQLLGFALLRRIGVESWVDKLRSAVDHSSIPNTIIYSLPGCLWSLGYILIIDWLFGNQTLAKRRAWAVIIPLLGVGSEVLQGFGILPGTYDFWDLIFYAVPYIFYLVFK